MAPEEIQQLKSVFAEVLNERRSIDAETHRKDHEFLHIMMEKEEKKIALVESTKKQVLGWAMIGVVGLIGYSLLEHLKTFLIKVLN